METLDIILLIIIGAFGLAGFVFGLVHTLGSLLGTILGAYLASRYYIIMADWLIDITGWQGNWVRVMMFIIAFFLINRLVGIGFFFIEKIFNLFKLLPFIKSFNRLAGLILGLSEGIITIGLVIFFIERFPLSDWIMIHLVNSTVAPYTRDIASILWPLLPEAFRLLESSVNFVEGVVK